MRYRPLAIIAATALFSSCTVGPDFERPAAPIARGYGVEQLEPNSAGPDQRFVADLDIPGQWWETFRSPKLNVLVEQALKANPTIDQAKAALRQASELRKAQWTEFLPLLQGDLSADRYKNAPASLANPSSINQNAAYYSLYTGQLSLSYVPDLFGATTRGVESARAQEENARFQLAATYLTLSSNVVSTAVQEASLRAQLAATERMIALQHDLTRILQQQRQIGTASQLDLLAQLSLDAQTAATLPPLQKQLAQTRDGLTALMGRLPDDMPAEEFHLEDLALPRDLPVSLPSKLVEQRPDVRAAEENLHQATAQVGIALANMLPQISLTGSLGSTGLKPSQLLTPNYGFWSLGTNLSQTLFDSGALLHKRRAADAAMDQAAALYRLTVITAFQNVADTLRALQSDGDAVIADQQAMQAATATLEIARQQFKLGTISSLALISAEQIALQAEMALVQAKANRYADTAGLFQALGGGWWNRPELAENP